MQPGDVYWCTADCGWVTGHTYLTYGPLLAGATNVLFGSTPMYPTIDRVWQVIARYKVRAASPGPHLLLCGPSPRRAYMLPGCFRNITQLTNRLQKAYFSSGGTANGLHTTIDR